jgi:hypothetical protein
VLRAIRAQGLLSAELQGFVELTFSSTQRSSLITLLCSFPHLIYRNLPGDMYLTYSIIGLLFTIVYTAVAASGSLPSI